MMLFEIMDRMGTTKAMGELAKELTLKWRDAAAKHGLTIDGTRGAHNSLPMVRKAFMLFGGRLKAKGTQAQELKRTTPLQDRVHAFMKEVWPELLKLQAHAINNDLETDYTVKVRMSDDVGDGFEDGLVPIEKVTLDQAFKALRFGATSTHTYPHATFVWKVERAGNEGN